MKIKGFSGDKNTSKISENNFAQTQPYSPRASIQIL